MPIIVIEAVAPVSSWRPPEAQNFHPTLPLPPYTSQVGLLGAAMGMSLPDTYGFVEEHDLSFGVGGWHNGKLRDLWKFQKLESIADAKKAIKHDIVLRDHFVDSRLIFVVEAKDQKIAEAIATGFREPQFPLTTGVSDALLHAQKVAVVNAELTPTRELAFTLVYRDIGADYTVDPEIINAQPMMKSLQAPSIESIVTGFKFDEDKKRTLTGRSVVTFVGDPISLSHSSEPVLAYKIQPTSKLLRKDMKEWKESILAIPVHRFK